jgi:signal recognition particle GTPase
MARCCSCVAGGEGSRVDYDVDTAGRCTQNEPMAELRKMRAAARAGPEPPAREIALVIEATTGQNGRSRRASLRESSAVTGII